MATHSAGGTSPDVHPVLETLADDVQPADAVRLHVTSATASVNRADFLRLLSTLVVGSDIGLHRAKSVRHEFEIAEAFLLLVLPI